MIRLYNNNNYRNRDSAPAIYRSQYLFNKENVLISSSTTSNNIIIISGSLQSTYRLEAQIFYNASQSLSDFNKTPITTHTPHFYGNTHDDDEAEVYFINHEHGCNVIDCPHHHEE